MSHSEKPKKRRIVPVQVVEEQKENLKEGPKWSETTQRHFKKLYDKDYVQGLHKRAIDLGYEKERKPRKENPKAQKRRKESENVDHGSHRESMHDLKDYVKAFCKMKNHGKHESLYSYLKKKFQAGMYFSSATKRFRKIK